MDAKDESEKPEQNSEAQDKKAIKTMKAEDKGRKVLIIGVVVLTAIFALVVFIGLAGVGALQYLNTENQSSQPEDQHNSDDVSFDDGQGNQVVISESAQLSQDFPAEVGLHEGGSVTASAKTVNNNRKHWVVSLHTDSDMQSAIPEIKEEFSQNGWSITSEYVTDKSGYYLADHQKFEVSVSFAQSTENGTDLTYSVTEKSPGSE